MQVSAFLYTRLWRWQPAVHAADREVDSSDTQFDEGMAQAGGGAHVFECASSLRTTEPTADSRLIKFQDWGVGSAHGKAGVGAADILDERFFELAEAMERLRHSSVDIWRFNLEGSEQDFQQEEIFESGTSGPTKLIFELHTAGGPRSLVEGRGFAEVNWLLFALHDGGCRIVSKGPAPRAAPRPRSRSRMRRGEVAAIRRRIPHLWAVRGADEWNDC